MCKRFLQVLLAPLLLAALSSPAFALKFKATIDGPQAGTPSTATGSATLELNAAETALTYTITFSGLSSAETGAHIHNAPVGLAGPNVHNLPLGSPKNGVWDSTPNPVALTPAMVAELKAGRLYIDIHSSTYPLGEIRGQILPNIPTTTNWGLVLLVLLLMTTAVIFFVRKRAAGTPEMP